MAKKKKTATPSKYAAVLRLVTAEPDISESDLVAKLRAVGVTGSESTVSNYRSKARKEIGVSKPRKGGRRRKVAHAAKAVAAPTAAAPTTPAATVTSRGLSANDFITLANIVKKIGAAEVQRFVAAIS